MKRKQHWKKISKKEKKKGPENSKKNKWQRISEEAWERMAGFSKILKKWDHTKLLEINHIFSIAVTLDSLIWFSKMTGFHIYLLNSKTTTQKSNHHSSANYTAYLGGVHKIQATSTRGSALKHSGFQSTRTILNVYIYSYANSTFPFMLFSDCFSNETLGCAAYRGC